MVVCVIRFSVSTANPLAAPWTGHSSPTSTFDAVQGELPEARGWLVQGPVSPPGFRSDGPRDVLLRRHVLVGSLPTGPTGPTGRSWATWKVLGPALSATIVTHFGGYPTLYLTAAVVAMLGSVLVLRIRAFPLSRNAVERLQGVTGDQEAALSAARERWEALGPHLSPERTAVGEVVLDLLDRLGRHDDALVFAARALDEARRQPRLRNVWKPAVIEALTVHAECLDRAGRLRESVSETAEAVRYWRSRKTPDPRRLAALVLLLGRRLERLSQHKRALATYTRLTAFLTGLPDPDPDDRSALAAALAGLGDSLSAAGRPWEALRYRAGSVALLRRLGDDRWLHAALTSLGNDHVRSHDFSGSLPIYLEAIEVGERLPGPGPTGSDLAAAVGNLGAAIADEDRATAYYNFSLRLRRAGRRRDAARYTGLAVDGMRVAGNERHLSAALLWLGIDLGECGEHQAGADAAQEAVEIYRRLAGDHPDVNLVRALNCWGLELARLGRLDEAVTRLEEAVRLGRRLAAEKPNDVLFMVLNSLAWALACAGRHAEALPYSTEAVADYRRLAAEDPTVYEHRLADALADRAVICSGLRLHREAAESSAEAVALFRRLSATEPARHRPNLAHSLVGYAEVRILADPDTRGGDVREAARDAVRLFEPLAADFPGAYAEQLRRATALSTRLEAAPTHDDVVFAPA